MELARIQREVAFDCETYLIQPGRLAPTMVCLTWSDGQASGLLRGSGAVAWMRQQLLDDSVMIWGANTAFDCAVMAEADITLLPLIFRAYDLGRIGDVQIDEMLRNIALGRHGFDPTMGMRGGRPTYSLAELSEKYLGERLEGKDDEDAWRFRYYELRNVPTSQWPREAVAYALYDAVVTMRVRRRQAAEARGGYETMPCLAESCQQGFGLHLESAWGLRTEPEAVTEFDQHLHALLDKLLDYLTDKGFYRWKGTKKEPRRDGRGKNLKFIKERVAAAYDRLADLGEEERGWPLTDTGKAKLKANAERLERGEAPEPITFDDVSTSGDTLKESCDPDLELLAEAEEYAKLKSSFLPTLRKGLILPINPRYNILVESMRTSCRKPNIQQMPRKGGVRECYVPRNGWIFGGCDYDTAELRSLAQNLLDGFGESAMAASLQAGRQLHLELAADILGIEYDEALKRHKAGDKEVKNARQLAKAANFGYPGGLGAAKFQAYARKGYDVRLELDECWSLKHKWQRRFPEMRAYHAAIGAALEEGGGKMAIVHPRTGFVRGGTRYCDSCNHFFQHLTAAGAKAAVYETMRECYIGITRTGEASPLFGCRPVAFVHDEQIVEIPLARFGWERTRAAARRLGEVQVEQMRRFTPDIPCIAEPHLMRRWYKEADPVHACPQCGAKGGKRCEPCGVETVLVPWEPKTPDKALDAALAKAKRTRAELEAALGGKVERITFEVAQFLPDWLGKDHGKTVDWLSVQRLRDLEEIAQARETQALVGDWRKYIEQYEDLESKED